MRRGVFSVLGVCLMLASVGACAAQVSASVDRHTVHMGDTLTLSITVKGSAGAASPDLDPLRKNFDVQQTSSSRNISIINGKSSATRVWGVALQPLHTGTITIPSINVAGGHTQALDVSVVPAASGAQGGPGDAAFVETSVQPASIYVGQQALFRVRFFYAAGLVPNGSLQQPKVADVDLQQLGKANQYQTRRGGRRYNVVERDYALIAHTPDSITLPAIGFQGQLGRGGGFPGFATNVRNINVRSPSVSLVVKAKPAAAANGPWLPSQNVTLTASGLPADGKAKVGDPLTLTLTEQAKGLSFDVLPALALPDIAGTRIYPDKPETRTDTDGPWLQGKRQRSFAIVPTRAGTLTIPAITLHWWNVDTDKPQVITLPARTLTVSAAAGSAPATPSAAASAAAASSVAPPAAGLAASPASTDSHRRWRWIAAALLVLWLATLGAWWWLARRPARQKTPASDAGQQQRSTRNARKAFRQALDTGDTASIGRALLAWAQSERRELHNLGEVAAALADADQRQAIAALERSRYGASDTGPDTDAIGKSFAQGFVWRVAARSKSSNEGLPPLYPFGDTDKQAD